jgi:L-alanine-DL-glutamate epimerase-like enolase superfamily enzyme
MSNKTSIPRRDFFRKSTAAAAAVAAGSLVTNADLENISANVNTNSQPSDLKITDLRLARIESRYILRLDTNQGIYGYGEMRGGTSKTSALMLKSRILGMNPCNVDKIFRKINQFAYHGRQGAGVSSIEMACWDLAGKAWGVPVWQMLGGKFRDKVLIYCDTTSSNDPLVQGNRLKERMETGYKYLKMDLMITNLFGREPGVLTRPPGNDQAVYNQYMDVPFNKIMHPFKGIRITEKGLKLVKEFVGTVRDIIGMEVPLAADHFGHFIVEDCIKIANSLEEFNLAYLEDMLPWQLTEQYVRLKNSVRTPILTGEDIHGKNGFMDLFEKQAISMCHPDIGPCGGCLEMKKIGDLAMEYGIGMNIHNGGLPPMMMANVHAAAATENFTALEHHHVDDEWYDDLYANISKPLVKDGYIDVPNSPGLGFELNEEVTKSLLREGDGWFDPTPEWDNERSHDRLWSLNPGGKATGNV